MDRHLSDNITDFIINTVGEEYVSFNEPMNEHTTFKIGGNATCFCKPQNKDQIKKLIAFFSENDVEYYVIGNGSNLLVSDDGFDGVVVQLLDDYSDVQIDGDGGDIIVKSKSGARMWKLGMSIAKAGGAGFEFATGIPGTIGGAVMMNAGAYGGEMKDIVESVLVCDKKGNELTLRGDELEFGYRTSAISTNGYIVLEVEIKLQAGDTQEIMSRIDDLTERRRSKQPLDIPSAGSTFKRPEGYYAAKLIDDAGLRGIKVGGAKVSEKHAGFVINTGGATAADVVALTDKIKEEVYKKDGVELELEVRKLGF